MANEHRPYPNALGSVSKPLELGIVQTLKSRRFIRNMYAIVGRQIKKVTTQMPVLLCQECFTFLSFSLTYCFVKAQSM